MGVPSPHLHAEAKPKSDLYKERYAILHQRTLRHDLFSQAVIGSQKEDKKFQLKPVEFLLGSNAKLGDIIVLGMLTQLKEVGTRYNSHSIFKFYLHELKFKLQFSLPYYILHLYLLSSIPFILFQGKWFLEDPTGAVQLDLSKSVSFGRSLGIY